MPVMTVQELLKNKQALENEIKVYLSDRVDRFTKDTGVAIRGINFDIVDVTRMGMPPEHIVDGVRIHLNL
jgi:hypothetical protein